MKIQTNFNENKKSIDRKISNRRFAENTSEYGGNTIHRGRGIRPSDPRVGLLHSMFVVCVCVLIGSGILSPTLALCSIVSHLPKLGTSPNAE